MKYWQMVKFKENPAHIASQGTDGSDPMIEEWTQVYNSEKTLRQAVEKLPEDERWVYRVEAHEKDEKRRNWHDIAIVNADEWALDGFKDIMKTYYN